jgi:hypothetical protein
MSDLIEPVGARLTLLNYVAALTSRQPTSISSSRARAWSCRVASELTVEQRVGHLEGAFLRPGRLRHRRRSRPFWRCDVNAQLASNMTSEVG